MLRKNLKYSFDIWLGKAILWLLITFTFKDGKRKIALVSLYVLVTNNPRVPGDFINLIFSDKPFSSIISKKQKKEWGLKSLKCLGQKLE